MLALTRKTDYALVAMVALAEAGAAPRSARDLADALRLPAAALRNILKDLARAGLLESTQGASGGYRLAQPAREVALVSIVRAIEGPVRLTPCCSDQTAPGEDGCRREDACRIKAVVRGLNDRLAGFFAETTLADLAAASADQAPAGRRPQSRLTPLTPTRSALA
ncbi:MAG: Rrf2 family transcriptional regulator [Planctomycetota bacterium]|nr:MAG: Rrf2 family transcriptional regulator [Planctomycetota bacterium]